MKFLLVIYPKKYIDYTKCKLNFEIYNKTNGICKIKFNITEKIKSTIFVYYQLKNFYLNHRKFVKSKNWNELRGKEVNTKRT